MRWIWRDFHTLVSVVVHLYDMTEIKAWRDGVLLASTRGNNPAEAVGAVIEELTREKPTSKYPNRALTDVLAERRRQDAKWGQRDHDPFIFLAILAEEMGEFSEAALHVLFGGSKAAGMREEAVQVAAVALAVVECLDRAKWQFRSQG
jgi:NTP pyrophosphatase (non-canonical NTP hydrolase)